MKLLQEIWDTLVDFWEFAVETVKALSEDDTDYWDH